MKEKVKSKKEKVGSRALRVIVVLTFSFCLFAFSITTSAHEPITTKVRFNKEVIRILQRSCLGCHQPGGVAMSLATYDEARPWAKAIKEEVLEKRMPPWRAVKGYGEFRNATSLTQRDIDLIVNWVEGGAPKGDDKDLPLGPLFSNDWQLGKPDLVLKPEAESKIAADADEHRVFILSTGLKQERWLRAIDLLPRNGTVVHCATVYLLKETQGAPEAPMTPVKKDGLSEAAVLATWMPGQKTVALDDGLGELLPAGSRLAVKIHYRGSGEVSTDLSGIGLYFTKSQPPRSLTAITVTAGDSVIPVAAGPDQRKASFVIQSDSQAIAARPAVNPLLISLQVTARRPDGSQEVLIWTRGYQFDWQPTYYFKQPVALPKGTRVEVVVYVDNSESNQFNPNDPPSQVRWSDITPDYWCLFLLAPGV